ncbi:enoyl-CoA hydratase/isomerase family protein [Planomicrobium sp. YIM 101495]|uniref:enoyl-CoA hydratase/isomerase family protein n=1 Tax=Planomicrobium sp. YIM 101495 TaxID=2665160 RepID=UPI0012B853A6|nr:enoyl-CoA hydratase-related protein [Planomicrobium sp. YIM 101495]MTD30589.1 enoyl-CoA hydratase [Planomicrobium sp. YIM 101495]
MDQWETLKLDESYAHENVYILKLNRPEAMNALNTKMGEELIECLGKLKKMPDLRVLILTGTGSKSFCVGGDLKERKGMTKEKWKLQHDIFEDAYKEIREFPFPVIALVNGYALGGGMEMVLSCDMNYLANHVKLGLPEVKIGIIPGAGGTQLLPRKIPQAIAKEYLFSGKQIEAEKAVSLGLSNGIYPVEQLLEEGINRAKEIAKNAPLSLQAIKQSVDRGLQTDLYSALAIELDQYYKCANSADRQEGVDAFNEKRQPAWSGI